MHFLCTRRKESSKRQQRSQAACRQELWYVMYSMRFLLDREKENRVPCAFAPFSVVFLRLLEIPSLSHFPESPHVLVLPVAANFLPSI